MPDRFKGTELSITNLSVAPDPAGRAAINVRVVFSDTEGVTHAYTNHVIVLDTDENKELHTAYEGFHKILLRTLEEIHYHDPKQRHTVATELHRGISESLVEDDSSDDLG